MDYSPTQEEMDRDFRPSRRPQSTVARNFSATLDELFKIDGDLDTLSKTVHQKRQSVNFQSAELEALEARIRATEARLKEASTKPTRKDSQRRSPLSKVVVDTANGAEDPPRRSEKTQMHRPDSTEKQDESAKGPGQDTEIAPVSRTASHVSKEYVIVDRPAKDQAVAS